MHEEAILNLIKSKPGLKAADIARDLNIDKTWVNSSLYGVLTKHVRQDPQYRWWPVVTKSSPFQEPVQPPCPKTPIGRLCQYYLDCLII